MRSRFKLWLAVTAMVVVFLAVAWAFHLPAGVFGLIGLAGWLLEKPLHRLSQRLAALAARMAERTEPDHVT